MSAQATGRLARLVDSTAFTGTIVALILMNAVVLGLQTYDRIEERYGDELNLLNEIFLGLFVVELALWIAAYGRRPWDFFRSGWNAFDFLVIGAAFIPGVRENATVLRLVRVLRVVRVVRLLPDVRILLVAVGRSLPPLFSITVLTVMILFAYGMVGWLLFAEQAPEQWGDIGRAMLSLFVMLTLENFPQYMEQGMEIHPWSWVYFVSFVLVAAFIVLNVLIGIVLNSMEEARELERRRSRAEGRPTPSRPLPGDAPVMERIAILRAALDELEEELATGGGPAGRDGGDPRRRERGLT